MILFYNIGIFLTGLGIRIASIWNKKAKKWVQGRKNWRQEWKDAHQKSNQNLLFQCASLGEYEQAVPLMKAYQKKGFSITVSFFSPSGFEYLSKKNHSWDAVLYLPLDKRSNAKKIIEIGNFKAVFFVKYELWYHLLTEAKRNNIPCFLVSATFRESHRYFKWYGGFFRKMLHALDGIFVQNMQSKNLLEQINIKSIVSGDTRFDRVWENSESLEEIEEIKKWKGGDSLLIAGSSWPEEEKIIASSKEDLNAFKILIAPHDLSKNHLDQIRMLFPEASFYSESGYPNPQVRIFVLDTIGLLSRCYKHSDIAIIGGGFSNKGLHNILEALCMGCPVLFGPNHKNFWEAQAAIEFGCAAEIKNKLEFPELIENLLQNRQSAQEFIKKNRGASEIVLNSVKIS